MSQFIEMFGACTHNVYLSTLCNVFIDGDWIESKDQSDVGIRLIQTGNIGDGYFRDKDDKARYISEQTFEHLKCTEVFPNDILISRLPDPIGRACVIPDGIGKSITAVDCTIVRLSDKILPEFFVAYTKTPMYHRQINEVATGTTRRRVSRANLGNIKITCPSLDKQQQFVDIVNQADKSKFVGFKSQFIEMFEDHNYTSVPLAELIDKSFPGEWGTEDENGNGTKVIRTTNITNSDKLDLSDVVTRNIVAAKLQKKQLCRGDILLERSGGTKDNPVGRVAYFDEDGVFVTNNFTQTLRCNDNIESRYLFYFLYYFYNLNKMKIRSMGNQTTGIQNLNMDDYMQISVIVPPRDLQKRFISIVTQADKSKYFS